MLFYRRGGAKIMLLNLDEKYYKEILRIFSLRVVEFSSAKLEKGAKTSSLVLRLPDVKPPCLNLAGVF